MGSALELTVFCTLPVGFTTAGKVDHHPSIPAQALRQNARSRRMSGELGSVDMRNARSSFQGSLQKRLKVCHGRLAVSLACRSAHGSMKREELPRGNQL